MTDSGIQLKSLSRQDPDFQKYLDGRFSKTERAIPLESLNVNSESEHVTFKIVPVAQIQRPPFFKLWSEVFKFRYFLLMAFPAFVILTKNLFDNIEIDPELTVLSLIAALFLIAAANLWNDYFDHAKGLDRIHPETQKKPIQKGWVTAWATKMWAWVYLVLGIAFGLPAVIVEPTILAVVAVPGAFALWAWLNPIKGLRFRRGAEVFLFLLVGPLFAVGFQLASSGYFDLECLWIGMLTGWVAVYLVHLRNFEDLMVNSQANFQSTVVNLGFERSKRLIIGWWAVLWSAFILYQWVYTPLLWWPIGSCAMALATIFPLQRKLSALQSPMGSELPQLVTSARSLVNVFWSWWLLQCLWLYLLMEMSTHLNG
jgi:1,4-dihydroxy-2-naphthoate octaprenyltransferase